VSENFSFANIGKSGGAADLIFVHGLTGGPITTWTCPGSGEPSGDYWPKWIYEDVPGLNVYTLGYPTSLFERWAKKEMSLYERAKASLDYIASFGLGDRPIGFVTHSLGGLLVKQIVRTGSEASDDGWNAIAKNCRLVIFLATPHTGSSLASAFTLALPRLSSQYLHLLRSDSSELDQLNAAYRRLAPELKISTAAYYETSKTKNLAVVVNRTDADPGVVGAEVVPVDADHIDICKPANRRHPLYLGVRRHVANLMANTTVPIAGQNNVRQRISQTREMSALVYGDHVAKEIYIVLPFDGETIFAVPIRYIIRTRGVATIRDVYLHAELSDALYLHRIERSLDKLSTAREINVFTDRGMSEHIARVLFKIPSIAPSVGVTLNDYIFAKNPTVLPVKSNVRSKDGVPMAINSKVISHFPIALSLDGEDVLPWFGGVNIHFRKGEMEAFLAVKQHENRLIKEIQRSGATRVQPTEVTFIGFNKFSKLLAGDGLPTILEADPASITAFNARLTPRGLEIREKLIGL